MPAGAGQGPHVCTVTEVDDGGATSVAYACEDDPGAAGTAGGGAGRGGSAVHGLTGPTRNPESRVVW